MVSAKPVIFISYSHKDEPEHPHGEEVAWLSYVQSYLYPAVKHGIFEVWNDSLLAGGANWDPEIEEKLRRCDIFVLLVSPHSMASDYIIDKEIAIVRERQANNETVHFYPILIAPTPKAGLEKIGDKNIRPRDLKALWLDPLPMRAKRMSDIADEIAAIANKIGARKSGDQAAGAPPKPAYVHIAGLPETPYEHLVGRDDELKRLDDAWADKNTNILSLIAEGGAGKSALVNEWLKRLQAGNYRGAETVLGWSFYSQGTKERATSAEPFLNWALDKLGIALDTTSATVKGDAIAEALMRRRVLLVLDGVEPLQHGPDGQFGQLKDQGLQALLRRFAATPPAEAHGLIVLTSRLAVADIAARKDGAAPVLDVEKLSDDAGAALLRDNGVWGTDRELKQASRDFGGHPLALGLLASFLKETQKGDVRRRDHIGALVGDSENPGHGHAARVMKSYEKEWLKDQPVLLAIMHIVGLFDRPASGDCLMALRAAPVIEGLTDAIVNLGDAAWRRAVARLREVRLLLPPDPAAQEALDAHPLVREWFGARLQESNAAAWKEAHGRLYEHLRDTTQEGEAPTLEDLAPLYQAIPHGCRAGRHREALDDVYANRICKRDADGRLLFYSHDLLGALGSDLAAISWFFDTPYEAPARALTESDRSWVLNEAAVGLRAQGRLAEALPAMRASLRMNEGRESWEGAAAAANNLSEAELLAGNVAAAIAVAEKSVTHADRSGDEFKIMANRTTLAEALHAAGKHAEARRLFADAEQRQMKCQPRFPLLYSMQGYGYCDLLLGAGDYGAVRERTARILGWEPPSASLLDRAMLRLTIGRAHLGLAFAGLDEPARAAVPIAGTRLDEAVEALRAAGQSDHLPRGLLSRAASRRGIGDWSGAGRDLDEVAEIAEPGPMRLFLCDLALERARLAFAMIESFAPLNNMVDDSPPKLKVPSEERQRELHAEASKQIEIAANYIEDCGYHRRDAELAELQSVLKGARKFADLPVRV